jgi:hypothetical protein
MLTAMLLRCVVMRALHTFLLSFALASSVQSSRSMAKFLFVLLLVLLLSTAVQGAENFSQRRRRSKELEDKLNNLDMATKNRIHAMKASGMPKEAIAEKIVYVAGDKHTARRIVDALHDGPQTKVKPSSNKKKPSNQPNSKPIGVNTAAKKTTDTSSGKKTQIKRK